MNSHKPIGRGANAVCVSNTYYLEYMIYDSLDRLWSNDKRGRRAYAVTADEGVELGCGEPLRTYGGSNLSAHPTCLVRGGSLYAAAGESVALSPVFEGTPPAGMKHDAFAASAGDFARSGDAWELTMPAGDVVVSATFAERITYEAWAATNVIDDAWDETDALGVHNIFRYAFDKPTGAFENPALLDIVIEGGNVVVKTPPIVNLEGFAISVVESSDVAGKAVTETKPLNSKGRTNFAVGSAPSRFYRLSATPGN